MTSLLERVRNWMMRPPETTGSSTTEIDHALQELKDLNTKNRRALDSVRQPDILRSLVISMNVGKNQ